MKIYLHAKYGALSASLWCISAFLPMFFIQLSEPFIAKIASRAHFCLHLVEKRPVHGVLQRTQVGSLGTLLRTLRMLIVLCKDKLMLASPKIMLESGDLQTRFLSLTTILATYFSSPLRWSRTKDTTKIYPLHPHYGTMQLCADFLLDCFISNDAMQQWAIWIAKRIGWLEDWCTFDASSP